jgi:DNA-binding NarL/FixJ family response regulator
MDATGWVQRVDREIARIGLRHVTALELTESERQVAELIGRGLTTRQAAAQLYLSPKTVEANLTRVYRKLGISSRAELGARLGGAHRQ